MLCPTAQYTFQCYCAQRAMFPSPTPFFSCAASEFTAETKWPTAVLCTAMLGSGKLQMCFHGSAPDQVSSPARYE